MVLFCEVRQGLPLKVHYIHEETIHRAMEQEYQQLFCLTDRMVWTINTHGPKKEEHVVYNFDKVVNMFVSLVVFHTKMTN